MADDVKKVLPTDEVRKEAPEAVRKIIEAMVSQALARCEREGIAWGDFYEAMLEVQKAHPTVSVAELFERTFRQLVGKVS